jgi:arylsulfatase A-like enzyme
MPAMMKSGGGVDNMARGPQHLVMAQIPTLDVINRRGFVAAAGALGASGLAACVRGPKRTPEGPPNVVFIMADDLGYADIGAYGGRHITSPAIDSLARDGVKLTHGYANSCVCSPTRAALATGMYQQRFAAGLEEPIGPRAPVDIGLPLTQPTIASVFRDRGYQTALVGKWHLGDPPAHGPLQHGYDSHFGIIQGAADYFRHRVDLSGQSLVDGLYRDNAQVEVPGYITDLFGEEAVRIIRERTRPLFLSLHFTAPHWPWEGPGDEAVSRDLSTIFHRDGGSLETYAAMVKSMDDNVGRVLAALEQTGQAENTIVVFTSDNGGERFSDTWPFVGVKGELLEGGIRVPLLVRWPGRIAAGAVCEQVMTSMDFLPTLLAAADGGAQIECDGENVLPVLTGDAPVRERTLYWRFKASEQAAVRRGAWKYLKLKQVEHLFNVAADPRERADLKDLRPDKFDELRNLFAGWNARMLPYPAQSYSAGVVGEYADRY